jgi:DNA-directed RNA polymerase specialized sigma24 family protein
MSHLGDATELTAVDAEAQRLALDGREREAADLLLSHLSSEIRSFLHRMLSDVVLVDEAHRATGERLPQEIPHLLTECSPRSWSYIVARREASRCRTRRAAGSGHEMAAKPLQTGVLPMGNTSTIDTVSTTCRDELEQLRASLSDEERDLLLLRVEYGFAWKEVACAFLEDDESDPDTILEEAARMRQRFRDIRSRVASAIANHRK